MTLCFNQKRVFSSTEKKKRKEKSSCSLPSQSTKLVVRMNSRVPKLDKIERADANWFDYLT